MDVNEFARAHPAMARIIAAAGLAVLAVSAAYAGDWLFALWIFLFIALTGLEWHGIAYGQVRTLTFALHLMGGALALAVTNLGHADVAYEILGVTAVLAAAAARHARRDPLWAMIGTLYTVGPGVMLVWLRAVAQPGAMTLIWIFAVVWATDMAALAVGRSVGGPKLSPRISPKKTWAGLGGGIVGAAIVGAAVAVFVPGANALAVASLSAVLAVIAQLGDLTESAFKRRFGVKDSGFLIPGQGGVLDRVDGLIFVAAAVALLAWANDRAVLILGSTP